ncbi:hypothetical protein DPMN_141912, partial [Dreissena polymorpha]
HITDYCDAIIPKDYITRCIGVDSSIRSVISCITDVCLLEDFTVCKAANLGPS